MNCPDCKGPALFEHIEDGYNDWRHRLVAAGVPIPSPLKLKQLALAQLATGGEDVIGALISIHHQKHSTIESARAAIGGGK
jgi:hypothetical protein